MKLQPITYTREQRRALRWKGINPDNIQLHRGHTSYSGEELRKLRAERGVGPVRKIIKEAK